MPAALVNMVVTALGADQSFVRGLTARFDRAYAILEARLSTVPYLAGDRFRVADLMTVFPLTTLRLFLPRDLTPYPAIRAFLRRIHARPAYQRAMAKAEPALQVPLD